MWMSWIIYAVCCTGIAHTTITIIVIIVIIIAIIDTTVALLVQHDMIECRLAGAHENPMLNVKHEKTNCETGTDNREGNSANFTLHRSTINYEKGNKV